MRDVDGTSEKHEELVAVFSRIKFQRLLLQSLVLMYPTKSFSPNEMEMAEISKLLTNAAELIPAIRKSIARGTQPGPESE